MCLYVQGDARCDLLLMTGAVGTLVWLICDITMLQTALDPVHEIKSRGEPKKRERCVGGHLETGRDDAALGKKTSSICSPETSTQTLEAAAAAAAAAWRDCGSASPLAALQEHRLIKYP